MPEPFRSNHTSYINAYIKTQKAHIIGKGREVVGVRKNGKTFPLDLIVSVITYNHEPYFIGVIRDISSEHSGINVVANCHAKMLDFLDLTHALQDRLRLHQSTDSSAQALSNSLHLRSGELLENYFMDERLIRNSRIDLHGLIQENLRKLLQRHPINKSQLTFNAKETCFVESDPTLLGFCLRILLINYLNYFEGGVIITLQQDRGNASVSIKPQQKTNHNHATSGQLLRFNDESESTDHLSTTTDKQSTQARTISQFLALTGGNCQIDLDKAQVPQATIRFPLTI